MSHVAAVGLSRAEIEDYAWQIRKHFGLEKINYFPILPFLELAITRLYPDFDYVIEETSSMGSIEGMNCLGERKIILPESVYEEAHGGGGRARFTIAHEIGHFFLHPKERLSLNRSQLKLAAFIDPEWQANEFAACLLMPKELIAACHDVNTVVEAFGVSAAAAEYRMRRLGKKI